MIDRSSPCTRTPHVSRVLRMSALSIYGLSLCEFGFDVASVSALQSIANTRPRRPIVVIVEGLGVDDLPLGDISIEQQAE